MGELTVISYKVFSKILFWVIRHPEEKELMISIEAEYSLFLYKVIKFTTALVPYIYLDETFDDYQKNFKNFIIKRKYSATTHR